MLSVEVLTLFPRMIAAPLEESILGKARSSGLLRVQVTDIREYAEGKHRVTDDVPYGGGAGMVMKPEPLVAAIEAAKARAPGARVVLMSPQGRKFDQQAGHELLQREQLILVCGRYEGVDERVLAFVDDEISIGDFILTGGELAALAVVDAVARLVPRVLPATESWKARTTRGLRSSAGSGCPRSCSRAITRKLRPGAASRLSSAPARAGRIS